MKRLILICIHNTNIMARLLLEAGAYHIALFRLHVGKYGLVENGAIWTTIFMSYRRERERKGKLLGKKDT